MADANSASSWPARRSGSSELPSASIRARVTASVLSSTLSFMPGRVVWISATRRAWKGAMRNSFPAAAMADRQAATRASGTANGMILTVATICPA